jgi:hypothetical protein
MQRSPLARNRHALYEAAVQGVEYDLDVFERIYRRHRGGRFRVLREDFCGTAQMACAWAARSASHLAIGVDHDPAVLAWSQRHRFPALHEAARRVRLVEGDVLRARTERADVVAAMNFSYWVFRTREALRRYFRAARSHLRRDGLFIVNAFGGTGAMQSLVERRQVPPSQGPDGLRIPGFHYVWEHRSFNPVDHRLRCSIHFRLGDGTWMRNAFRYDWRLWTLPEIQEVMGEAGFRRAEVLVEGWNDRLHRSDETYRVRRSFENQEGWLALVVGLP